MEPAFVMLLIAGCVAHFSVPNVVQLLFNRKDTENTKQREAPLCNSVSLWLNSRRSEQGVQVYNPNKRKRMDEVLIQERCFAQSREQKRRKVPAYSTPTSNFKHQTLNNSAHFNKKTF